MGPSGSITKNRGGNEAAKSPKFVGLWAPNFGGPFQVSFIYFLCDQVLIRPNNIIYCIIIKI